MLMLCLYTHLQIWKHKRPQRHKSITSMKNTDNKHPITGCICLRVFNSVSVHEINAENEGKLVKSFDFHNILQKNLKAIPQKWGGQTFKILPKSLANANIVYFKISVNLRLLTLGYKVKIWFKKMNLIGLLSFPWSQSSFVSSPRN